MLLAAATSMVGDVLGWYYCTNNRSAYKPDGAPYDNAANCKIILRKNGEIRYQYRTMGGTLNSATIGLQGTNLPGNSLVVAFNENYAKTNLATSFLPPVPPVAPWLTCAPASLSVAAGATTTLQFFANAAGLAPGVYTTSITLTHNDPDAPALQVPVWLVVPEPAGAIIALVLLIRRGFSRGIRAP